MANRQRKSDARWRANLSLCFDALKHLVPDGNKKKKIAKPKILQKASEHIALLEETLQELYMQRDPSSAEPPFSLEELKETFAKQSEVNDQAKTQRRRKKHSDELCEITPTLSEVNHTTRMQESTDTIPKCQKSKKTVLQSLLISPVTTPKTSARTTVSKRCMSQTITSNKASQLIMSNEETQTAASTIACQTVSSNEPSSPISIPTFNSSLFTTPIKGSLLASSQKSWKESVGSDLYSSPEFLNRHPAFVTPTKQTRSIEKNAKVLSFSLTDSSQFSELGDATADEFPEGLYCEEHNCSLDDVNTRPPALIRKKKFKKKVQKSKPSCCRQLERDYMTDDYLISNVKTLLPDDEALPMCELCEDAQTDQESQIMQSLYKIWHGQLTPVKDSVDAFTSLNMSDIEVSDSPLDDTARVPECAANITIGSSPSSDITFQLVPDSDDMALLGSPTLIPLSHSACYEYSCFSEVLNEFHEP